jgi:uncharacterized circularly permuted ATP-grasp superfamily protein
MADIAAAIQHYHDLLADGLAQTTYEHLSHTLKQEKLYFGQVPVCRVLRPHFYTDDAWAYLSKRTELVLQAFARCHAASMIDPECRVQLGLEPFEEELFVLDAHHHIRVPWSSSRLDAFFRPETGYLRFVEYNAETPAGIGYGDKLTDAFMSLDVMKRFEERYEVLRTYGLPQLLGVILRGYTDWGGTIKPQIAIADWQDVPTLNEHVITADYFEQHGYKTIMADPREMVYRDGQLWVGDFRVDIIYKRVLISELIRRCGIDCDVVKAVRDHATFITNSFSAKLLAKKASLAFLSDERNSRFFSVDELSAIEQHIPWTRTVEDRPTIYEGKEIDLLSYISNRRDRFVIKPNDEYGGSGVVLGWECDQEAWDAVIQHALNAPHVVQEKVTIVKRNYPALIDGTLDVSPRYVDADPYVFYGDRVGGCLTRLSGGELLNVTAGSGSVVPMFVIKDR